MATTTKLKLAFVLDDGLDKPDGVQQYVLSLGSWLSTYGHEVHYIVGQTSRRDIANIHSVSRNINWRFNGNRGTMPLPSSRTKLRKLLDHEQFDVLHVQVPYSPFMAHRLVLLATNKTVIIGTFHVAPAGRLMGAGTRLLGKLLIKSILRFERMLSVSTAAQQFARETFSIDSTVLPNVIDYSRFSTAQPLKQYDDTTPTILFLGRLVPRKGCALLLEAITLLKQRGIRKCRVLVCGRGPLERYLKDYVSNNQIDDWVEFVGFVSEQDKPRYYATADIAVFPSSGGESFGIVLLEAMASGKAAVLAGNNPGYKTVMFPQPELLFDTKNAAQLAGKIESFLMNEQRRSELAIWGKNYTAGFDVQVIGTQLLDVYQDALQKRRNK